VIASRPLFSGRPCCVYICKYACRVSPTSRPPTASGEYQHSTPSRVAFGTEAVANESMQNWRNLLFCAVANGTGAADAPYVELPVANHHEYCRRSDPSRKEEAPDHKRESKTWLLVNVEHLSLTMPPQSARHVYERATSRSPNH